MSVNLTAVEPFTAGEKPDPLAYTFQTSAGAPMTGISGTVVAKFQWRRRGDTAAATVANATFAAGTGVATYVWSGAEMAVGGVYDAELWIGNLTSRYASVKITYTVRDALIAAPAI